MGRLPGQLVEAPVEGLLADLIDRILTRFAAGDNSQTVHTEEIQRALAQLAAAAAALAKAMDALPNYPNPAVK